jgi:hypothetical protein
MRKIIATILLIIIPAAFGIVSQISKWENTKYPGIILFGYVSKRILKNDTPALEVSKFSLYLSPFYFGTLGATVVFNQLDPSWIGNGILLILIG